MKIIVVAGASGGHIYPALAFLESLKDGKVVTEALLVLPLRSIKADFNSSGYQIKYISSARASFSLSLKNIISIFHSLKGFWESLCIFLKFKPDIVVGFGSIDSIAMVMLAWFFRAKVLIHEQNVIPGKANKFLAKFADCLAISFPESRRYFDLPAGKLALTGNPIRQGLKRLSKEEALRPFSLEKNKFTILVMGGSQGSQNINSAFLKVAAQLKDRSKLQVIHLLGRGDCQEASQIYKKMDIKAKVFNFFSSMEFAYSAADLAICRTGATTIAELIHFTLPAVLMPYPDVSVHQLENAEILREKGAGVIINEAELKGDRLKELLESYLNNPDRVLTMRAQYAGLFESDAANELIKLVRSLG
jgi:UDP-N-acetylglucosamine--N-acetylmuramyl-(pentapeptide) pyrophosphoryl-undecaprenol N-acetylglucosamine transferase